MIWLVIIYIYIFHFIGGKEVILNFRQEEPSDNVSSSEVLKALGIQPPVDQQGADGSSSSLPQKTES